MKIDSEAMSRLSQSSKFELSEQENRHIISEIEAMMPYFEELKKAEKSDGKIIANLSSKTNVLREDKARDVDFEREKLLKNCAEVEDGAYAVPKLME